VPESKGEVAVDQLVAGRDGLRQQLVDLRLLVVDLLKENQLLRGCLLCRHLWQASGCPQRLLARASSYSSWPFL
jgi:hypothetical protein